MSGGSYDYLCFKDANQINEHIDDLERMIKRLVELDIKDAAELSEKLRIHLELSHIRTEQMLKVLSEVWQAVEWTDSGDWGDDTLKEVIKKWRSENATSLFILEFFREE